MNIGSMSLSSYYLLQETGAYSPSDAIDEYKSGSDGDKSVSDEEKSVSDDDKGAFGSEESSPETKDMEEKLEIESMGDVKSAVIETQESTLAQDDTEIESQVPMLTDKFSAEIPFIKTEIFDTEMKLSVTEGLTVEQNQSSTPVKMETVSADVPFELDNIKTDSVKATHAELSAQTTITNVKLETTNLIENNYLFNKASHETGSNTNESSMTEKELTNEFKEEITKSSSEIHTEEVKEITTMLDDLDEVPNTQEKKEFFEEVLSKVDDETEACGNLSSPPPQLDEEVESRDKIFNSDTSSMPDSLLTVVQTPTVNSSLDGNVEMTNKQPAPPPAGIKIKINLFNKAPVVSAPMLPATISLTTLSDPVTALPSSAAMPENGSVSLNSASDENALTNKPRLIGRKLTVLPPMTKGVETSGLCSIM